MKKHLFIYLITFLIAGMVACGKQNPEVAGDVLPEVQEDVEQVEEGALQAENEEIHDELPPEPRDVVFETPQGRSLQGRYFPAATGNAPIIVLTHWVAANQDDWQVVAAWLQNRGQVLPGSCSRPSGCTWWDSAWFPQMENRSFAVFTYSLTSCESPDGCADWDGPTWAEDANAAIAYASQLEGVDPVRIFTAGASIGADAAIDSCAWLNEQGGQARCVGTASLSPGNYLLLDYAEQVEKLEDANTPVWCLASSSDGESYPTCKNAEGTNYQVYEFQMPGHGMTLIAENAIPDGSEQNTLELLIDILDSVITP